MSQSPCLKVPRNYGERGLAFVKSLGVFNTSLEIEREPDYLYLPLTRELNSEEAAEMKKTLLEFTVCSRVFLERAESRMSPVDLLADKVPPSVLASLPHSIDFVGDIAVIEITPELETYRLAIGEAILKANKRVKTVLSKWGAVTGTYRLRPFEVIAGVNQTQTVHREYGCVFHVDLAQAYFSPRLSFEHDRVASVVRPGETVVDMFAGIGPFAILIGKRLEDVHVHAIDLNPKAFQFLKKNIAVNRVGSRVKPILGDARQIIHEKLKESATRVIMNLPERAVQYVDAACEALVPHGGIIHYYEFSNSPEPLEDAKNRLADAVKQSGRKLDSVLSARIVRGIAPFTYQVVVDAKVK